MKYSTYGTVLFACFPGIQILAGPVTADATDPFGAACEMRRECVEMASKDGRTTLAVEMRVGRYVVTEKTFDWAQQNCAQIREKCSQMVPSERYRYPECLIVEEFDVRRAGDFTARAMLYERGYNREKARSRTKGTPQHMREVLSPFDALSFRVKYAWDSYVMVSYGMVGAERWFPWEVHLKKVGNRYWLTEESGASNLSSISHQFSAPYLRDDATVLAQPPKDMMQLRLSLDQGSAIEKRHLSLQIEALQDEVAEDSTAVVLYVRPIFEGAAGPLLNVDTELLIPPAAALQSALALYKSDAVTIDEIVDLWVPEAWENVEANLRHLQEADYPLNSRFFGQAIDKVQLIARVETEEGLVWYVQYPSVRVDLEAKDPQGRVTRRAAFRTLIQRKIDGKYKLAQHLEDSAVSDILTNKEVVSFISRSFDSNP